jgi:hypothetical protein
VTVKNAVTTEGDPHDQADSETPDRITFEP